jgi:Tol biopolymer transport system component/DNA-binding winged helix-turn-helix (wHTH) protein
MRNGTEKAPIYTFGPYQLDPSERLLSRDGTALALTPKAFDLLVYLVERHGRLVEKTTLLNALWPDTVVEEANVAYNIAALRKVLGDGRGDAQFIETVPTRGYRFVAPVVEAPSASNLPDFHGRRLGFVVARLTVPLVATVVVGSAAGAWLLLRSPSRPEAPPMRLVPLTTLTGLEDNPTFSPDGEQVAFGWNGAKQDNWDIYVTLVGSYEERRLTSDPAAETRPEWSPDGRQIAYLRERPGGTTIQLVSVLGGADRKVCDFAGADSIGWTRDGHWLIVGRPGEDSQPEPPRGIYLIPVEGGDPRPLIASPPGVADFLPAFSPDGRQLAYVSCSHAPAAGVGAWTRCEIRLVEVHGARVTSTLRRLTSQLPFIASVSWTRDGSAVIFAAKDQLAGALLTLFRVGADGTHPPERIEIAGINAGAPAIAPSRDRLAFTRSSQDMDIYRLEVGRPAQLLVGSTFEEVEARLSHDGRRLVFASRRSGDTLDIWMADADGSAVQLLTRRPSRIKGSPYWSPDGRRVVFDSFGDDYHWHIWTVDAEGGTPRRLTTQAGDENTPTWSHDGRYVYFSADPGSGRDIWRVLASGGVPERLTRGVRGYFACESADGKNLLFQPEDADTPLMAMALTGGEVRQLVTCVRNSAFGAGPQGIYYVPCDPSPDPSVHVLDLNTGRDRRLGTLDGLMDRPLGLSVSPDGNTIVYPRTGPSTADLMLIENFR